MLWVVGLSSALLRSPHLHALTVSEGSATDGNQVLRLEGTIEVGDLAKLNAALQRATTPVTLSLDSFGGNVTEVDRMATLIRAANVNVRVENGDICASACFLLFAAGSSRFAGKNSFIGVHSASVSGSENTSTLAMTTLIARVAADLGVPSSIIGKLVTTAPGEITWLDAADLESMNVDVAPPGLAVAETAEFRGYYTCAQGLTKLVLRVPTSSSGGEQSAVFAFSAAPTNTWVPHGSFSMRGRIDLSGGTIRLKPAAWIDRPGPLWSMVGLDGASDDGGLSFSGNVTRAPGCREFFVARARWQAGVTLAFPKGTILGRVRAR
jgi:hypothetical protein